MPESVKERQIIRLFPFVIFLIAFFTPLVFSAQNAVFSENPGKEVPVYFFWGPGCPFCENQKPFLEELDQKYPEVEVKSFSTAVAENRDLFSEVGEILGVRTGPVPFTVIGEKHWVGYSSHLDSQMEEKVVSCIEKDCDDPLMHLFEETAPSPTPTPTPDEPENDDEPMVPDEPDDDEPMVPDEPDDEDEPKQDPVILPTIDLPFFGEIEIEEPAFIELTALIAFVDGFNPCSVFLIMFLFGMLICLGSKKKFFIAGMSFLLVIALIYGLFILGTINFLAIMPYAYILMPIAGITALVFAIINITEFLFYKKGISVTDSDQNKPNTFKSFQKALPIFKSTFFIVIGILIITAALTLDELSCTAGFPFIWTNVLASHNIVGLEFALLFTLYILVYLSTAIAVFAGAFLLMKLLKFEENMTLKLIGGFILLALALVLLFAPNIAYNLNSSLIIFVLAVISALLTAFGYDKLFGSKKEVV